MPIILFVFVTFPLHAGIDVTFLATEKPKEVETLRIQREARPDELPVPVRINGIVVFLSGHHYSGVEVHEPERFNKLKEGMALREIVSLLGPGSQNSSTGIGFISWRCVDGRILLVWPTVELDEKAKYYVSLHGNNQRHDDVGRLAKALIARLDITKQKVAVILTEDTHQAKAGEVKTYEIGQTFQKVDPLPRIDFTIIRIEGATVHCRYFYQATPEGLLHYSETGTLILQNHEQAAPSNR